MLAFLKSDTRYQISKVCVRCESCNDAVLGHELVCGGRMALQGVRRPNGAAGVCGGRMALRGVRLPNGAAVCGKTRTDVTDPVFSHSLTHKAIPCLNDTYRTPPQQVMHTHGRPANISMPVTVRELRSHPVLRATLLAVLFEHLRGVALLGLVKRSC